MTYGCDVAAVGAGVSLDGVAPQGATVFAVLATVECSLWRSHDEGLLWQALNSWYVSLLVLLVPAVNLLLVLLGYQGWQLWQSPHPSSGFNAMEELLETLLYLALSYQLGPWQWVPIGLWWGLVVLFTGLMMRRL